MLRARCLVGFASVVAALAAVAACSDNDAIISTDPPTPVFVPATSTAACTAPASACVLAAADVSADTASTVSTAVPNAGVTGSSVTAPSQGGCAYGTSADGGSGVTVNADFFCGLSESTSTAYVEGYKDQVGTGMATSIAGLGDYAAWIPNGTNGTVAALKGNAYVTIAYVDASGATPAAIAQANAVAVAKGYLAALF